MGNRAKVIGKWMLHACALLLVAVGLGIARGFRMASILAGNEGDIEYPDAL